MFFYSEQSEKTLSVFSILGNFYYFLLHRKGLGQGWTKTISFVFCFWQKKKLAFKNVSNCLNTKIYTTLETSGGQSSNLYLNVVHFSTPVLIRHLWQLKTVFPALVSNMCCYIRFQIISYIRNDFYFWRTPFVNLICAN